MNEISRQKEHLLTPEYWNGLDLSKLNSNGEFSSKITCSYTPSRLERVNAALYLGNFLTYASGAGFRNTTEKILPADQSTPDIASLTHGNKLALVERETIVKTFPTRKIAPNTGRSQVATPLTKEILPYWYSIYHSDEQIKRWNDRIVFKVKR